MHQIAPVGRVSQPSHPHTRPREVSHETTDEQERELPREECAAIEADNPQTGVCHMIEHFACGQEGGWNCRHDGDDEPGPEPMPKLRHEVTSPVEKPANREKHPVVRKEPWLRYHAPGSVR